MSEEKDDYFEFCCIVSDHGNWGGRHIRVVRRISTIKSSPRAQCKFKEANEVGVPPSKLGDAHYNRNNYGKFLC